MLARCRGAALATGAGSPRLTDTQIKCSDRKHNKVIRGCDMSVKEDRRMNCHSLSEPIHCLIRDVPHTTVGTPRPRRCFFAKYPIQREETRIPTQAVCGSLLGDCVLLPSPRRGAAAYSGEGGFVDRFHKGCIGNIVFGGGFLFIYRKHFFYIIDVFWIIGCFVYLVPPVRCCSLSMF